MWVVFPALCVQDGPKLRGLKHLSIWSRPSLDFGKLSNMASETPSHYFYETGFMQILQIVFVIRELKMEITNW